MMTNKTETQDRQAYLAEHMSVPFYDNCGHPDGLRYLLRRNCWCTAYAAFSPEDDHGGTPQCKDGWLYDDRPNALTEAIVDRGWRAVHSIESPYHIVEIYKPDGYSPTGSTLIGMVDSNDKLRGQEALEVALYRACRAEEGE